MESSSSSSSPEISHSAPAFDPSFFAYASLDDVLEELSTRFIMNLPDTELTSVERMCFQVEQAHWYYEDFMREANPKLPSLNLKKFISIFFNSCPLLRQWSAEHEQLFNHFMHYKVRVPVCGAIMLNDRWDKCILVKGWKSSAGWGFPKGKINQNEPSHECAAREVAEETGFNISSYIRPEDYIELTIREQRVTLFIVGGIPEDYPFQTRTRKEISKIQWFKLSDLPSWKRNKQVPGKFYLISPFVHPLKEFIRVNKPAKRRQNQRKDGNDSAADLSFQTDIDGEDNCQNDDMSQHRTSVSAVDLDRDVHGYSSSSVDNGEPQTPSPQSIEALPITTEIATESKADFPMDPHFARLLDGLSLSASKPALNGKTKGRSSSVTPTSARSNLPSTRNVDGTTTGTERALPEQSSNPVDTGSSSGVRSPSDSLRSDSSMNTVKLQGVQPTLSTTSLPSVPSDRHLKHLALLESVAQELTTSTTPPGTRHLVHPGPPSSVPPVLFNAESAHIQGAPLPTLGINKLVPFVATERSAPTYLNDPFTVRPMTSQALLPPSSVRRHGPSTSMHQDSLLSILSHPNSAGNGNSVGPRRSPQTLGPNSAHDPVPYAARGLVQPAPNVPPSQTHALASQPLRVMPPPPGSFQFNPGPLTAPLASSPGQPHPSFPNIGVNKTFDTYKTHSPNAAQLLSLLNSNTSAKPTMLITNANRRNFSAGGPAAPSI